MSGGSILPNLKDQVSGGSIDCVTLPNLKDQVSGGSIDCVSLPNLKDQVSGGSIDCVTLPNIKDLVSGLSIDYRKMDMMVVGAGGNVNGREGGWGHFFQAQYGE